MTIESCLKQARGMLYRDLRYRDDIGDRPALLEMTDLMAQDWVIYLGWECMIIRRIAWGTDRYILCGKEQQ
jgi:hypothetical protein